MIKLVPKRQVIIFSLLLRLLIQHCELQACSLCFWFHKFPLAFYIFPCWFLPFSPNLPMLVMQRTLSPVPIDDTHFHGQVHLDSTEVMGGENRSIDAPLWISRKQVPWPVASSQNTASCLVLLMTTQLPSIPFFHVDSLLCRTWNSKYFLM